MIRTENRTENPPVLRAACIQDSAQIAAILNAEILEGTASWTETPKSISEIESWYDERLAAGYAVLVIADRQRVCAYGSYGAFRKGEGYRETVEHSVYVAANQRRRGHGRRLLEGLIDHAAAAGFRRMIGGVSADQEASLALHRTLGFREAGRLPGVGVKHGLRLDLVLMLRVLGAD
ncbi:MAG: N-acetyltransferase family protein [Pseudomonadota bacterium]